jgi:hypothetical protein
LATSGDRNLAVDNFQTGLTEFPADRLLKE